MYREDSVTKTNRGGLKDMKKERKVVWIKPIFRSIKVPNKVDTKIYVAVT